MKNASVAVSVFLLFGSLTDAQATDLYTLGNGQIFDWQQLPH